MGGGGKEVFDVVEHQQKPAWAQVRREHLGYLAGSDLAQAERVRDGWQHVTGVGHGGERHEYHPVAVTGPLGDRERQPGLADAARAAGGGVFTLTLTDSTQGWTQTTSQTSDAAQLGSAEVIAEAPSDGTGAVLPLSNFGTVNFTDATADNTAIGNENPTALTMVSGNNVTEATPSALTGGNAFTVVLVAATDVPG